MNKIRPFHRGSEYIAWTDHNCDVCKKGCVNNNKIVCDIEKKLAEACIGDGYIPEDIAARMGITWNHKIAVVNEACLEYEEMEQ